LLLLLSDERMLQLILYQMIQIKCSKDNLIDVQFDLMTLI